MIKLMLHAVLEQMLNQVLAHNRQHDPLGERQQSVLEGKICRITLNELGVSHYLAFSKGQVDVLGQFEGEVDAHLALSLQALPKLKEQQITELIKQDLLSIEGDIQLVGKLVDTLRPVAFDLEEWLSGYLGDVPAYSLVQGERALRHRVQRDGQRAQQWLGDYLVEEVRLAPGKLEVQNFNDDVEVLRRDLQRLELKLLNLQDKLS